MNVALDCPHPEWGERAHWVHAAGIDSLRKQKYDRLDAKRLAKTAVARSRAHCVYGV